MVETEKPPRVQPRIKSAPRTRQIYWCDLPRDAQLPEFWKRRPVLIISRTSFLSGHFSALPITTVEQSENKWAYEIISPFGAIPSWVICNHILTMACSRLHAQENAIPRLEKSDFRAVIDLMLETLPLPKS